MEASTSGRQRGPRRDAEYLVFRQMTLKEAVESKLVSEGDEVLVAVGPRMSRSRMDAIRAQAEADENSGVPYASVAKTDLTVHAPEKETRWR